MKLSPMMYLVSGSLALLVAGCGSRPSTDASGRLLDAKVLGETGTHPGQFVYPRAMDAFTDHDQDLAVVIDKTARMQIINLATGESIGETIMPVFDRGMPTGVTVGKSLLDHTKLAAYVADTHEHRVLVYEFPLDDNGPDFMFGAFGNEQGQFVYPTDVIVRTNTNGAVNELIISEYGGNDRITRYRVDRSQDISGEQVSLSWIGQIGTPSDTIDGSDAEIALSRPQSIAIWDHDGTQELIVTDSSHHRVGRLTLDGQLIAWYEKSHDPDHPPMEFPYGVTVLDDNSALVSEFGGNVVRRIDLATGITLDMFGSAGRGDGQLATPWTSDVINHELVILDSGNNRIQIIPFDGSRHAAIAGNHP